MLQELTDSDYLNLVNSGNVVLPKFPAGVYKLRNQFVAYRKDKQSAALGTLRNTEEEATKDLEEELPKFTITAESRLNPLDAYKVNDKK